MFKHFSIFHFMMPRILIIAALFVICGHLSAQEPDTEDIRPAKALIEIPQPEKSPILLWASIAAAVIALTTAVVLIRRHRSKVKSKSPQEIALSKLTELEKSHTTITAEDFANHAAATLRQYIFDCFGLAAPKRTTEEFLNDVEKSPLIGQNDRLRSFLKSCDLAKFAGDNLATTQRTELLQYARDFIRGTSIKPKPPVSPS